MVRHTDADDEATFELITDGTQVAEGDTVDIHGQDFLPKSNLRVIDVDPDWADDTEGTVFTAKIPNHKNAREYSFRVVNGWVETTGSRGTWGPSVTAKVEVDDEPTPEDRADAYADDPSQDTFDAIVDAVEREYAEDDHDPATSTVLTPVGLAARLAADAVGFDASSMIGFDREDEVTVPYDSFEQDDPHATPMPIVRLAGYADAATDRTVRFRDGAGSVRVFVEAPERNDDVDESDE